jgi:hypothetical protein
MKRPTLYTIALALMLVACVAFLVAMRPECSCTLGGVDYFDSTTDVPEDCQVHGEATE